MDVTLKLDEYFLGQTKKIYKWLHELCGIHNLTLAKNFLTISYVLIFICLTSYSIMIAKSILLMIATLIIVIMFTKFMLLVWSMLVFNFSNIKKDTLNKSRIQLRGPRLYGMVFGILFLIPDFARFFSQINWFFFVGSLIFSAGLHFILFSIGVYFGSIEPEPPCESKLKKLVEKIKSWLQSEPIPQPV